jgi:hypothetical protein
MAFALAVCVVPLLFWAFLKLFVDSGLAWSSYFYSAVMCIVWLVFADGVRKFTNGQRLINQFTFKRGFRTIGNLRKDTLARWATLLLDVLGLIGLGWCAMYAASAA